MTRKAVAYTAIYRGVAIAPETRIFTTRRDLIAWIEERLESGEFSKRARRSINLEKAWRFMQIYGAIPLRIDCQIRNGVALILKPA